MQLPGTRPTGRGATLLLVGVGLCVGAWFGREATLLWPGLFLVLLPLASLLPLLAPGLAARRTVEPGEVEVGTPVRIGLELWHERALAPWSVVATDVPPPAFGPRHSFSVAGRDGRTAASEHYDRPAGRRGRYQLDGLSCAYSDPLGLVSRRLQVSAPASVIVTPRVLALDAAEPAASGRTGETPIPHLAYAGPDDVLVREYRPRDDVRRIHWPSTARTGTLMVRREEQAWDPTAWVLLDSRATGRGSEPRLEWLISLAASVGVTLLDAGYDVGLSLPDGATFVSQAKEHGTPTREWLVRLVDVEASRADGLTAALRGLASGPAGHLVVALLGRLTVEDARGLAQIVDGQQRRWALYVPDVGASAEEAAALDVLTEHDWRTAAVPLDLNPGPAWRSLGGTPSRRSS